MHAPLLQQQHVMVTHTHTHTHTRTHTHTHKHKNMLRYAARWIGLRLTGAEVTAEAGPVA